MPQRGKKSTGFEQMYPNIAKWVNSYGWIEIGDDGGAALRRETHRNLLADAAGGAGDNCSPSFETRHVPGPWLWLESAGCRERLVAAHQAR